MGHQAIGSTCHTGIQCRAAGVKHPSYGVGVVMSNEASNHKAAPFPQLSWRDKVIMLKKEVGGTKQPSFHSLLNPFLPHLLQVNHMLLLPLFCLMGDAGRLGKALTRGTHVSKPAGQHPLKIRNTPRLPRGKITSFLLILIL